MPVLRSFNKRTSLFHSTKRSHLPNNPLAHVTKTYLELPISSRLCRCSLGEPCDFSGFTYDPFSHGWRSLLGCARGSTSYPGILGLLRQPPCRRSTSCLEKAAMSKSYAVVQIRASHWDLCSCRVHSSSLVILNSYRMFLGKYSMFMLLNERVLPLRSSPEITCGAVRAPRQRDLTRLDIHDLTQLKRLLNSRRGVLIVGLISYDSIDYNLRPSKGRYAKRPRPR